MGKLFQTPEYVVRAIKEIMKSDLINDSDTDSKSGKDGVDSVVENHEDEAKTLFRLWLIDQIERYPRVKKDVAPYMKAKGKILPSDRIDFIRWFVKEAKKSDDYLAVKIEDFHFELYHEERLKAMNTPLRWEGLYVKLSDAGYIQTNLEVFNQVMEFKQCPTDKHKIQWLTSKADALYFQSSVNFTMPQFNSCFRSNDGRKFAENQRSTTVRNNTLTKIIKEL